MEKRNVSFAKVRKSSVVLFLSFVLLGLMSCGPNTNEGEMDWARVSLSIDQTGKSASVGRNAVIGGSEHVLSALIVVVPETVTSVGSTSYLTDTAGFYARAMLGSDGTVELTLPLGTSVRIVQVTFIGEYTLDEVTDGTPVAFTAGVSDAMSFTASGTEVTVSISLSNDTPAVVSTSPESGATGIAPGATLSVSFNQPMDSTTLVANFTGTSCTGSIQVSADDFQTCATFDVSSIESSTDGATVSGSILGNMAMSATYKLKITTDATNLSGEALASDFVTSTGFTTGIGVGGTVVGLISGNSLVLQNDGGDDLTVDSNSSFNFGEALAVGDSYSVTVSTQPDLGSCVVGDGTGSGTVPNGGATGVRVYCLMGGAVLGNALEFTPTEDPPGTPNSNANASVTNFAGAGPGAGGNTDACESSAEFDEPYGVTTDGSFLYVADYYNSAVRKLKISTGCVTTMVPTGTFSSPLDITTDGTYLYVIANNHRVFKISISDETVTSIAGADVSGTDDDTDGASAGFSNPQGITTDGVNLYVADTNNYAIRQIRISDNYVTTLAGQTGGASGTSDASEGTNATFYYPKGITTDGANLYVVENFNCTIRLVSLSGDNAVTTVAGNSSCYSWTDGTGLSAGFDYPVRLATEGNNLFATETYTIRRISLSDWNVTTIVGTAYGSGYSEGIGLNAAIESGTKSLVTDGSDLYLGDSGNHAIRKISISE